MIARRSFLLSAAALYSGMDATAEVAKPTKSLQGLRHLAYGDSVIAGENMFGKPITRSLTQRVGLNSFNACIGGTSLARGLNEIYDSLSMYELCNAQITGDWKAQDAAVDTFLADRKAYYSNVLSVLKSTPLTSVDIATISFGVNDFAGNRPIGSDNDDTKETFKGAINYVISRFLSNRNLRTML